jgi:hypothetical protein
MVLRAESALYRSRLSLAQRWLVVGWCRFKFGTNGGGNHGPANSRARYILETPTFYVGIEWYLRSVITKTIPLSL